jgi:hypothetical protein
MRMWEPYSSIWKVDKDTFLVTYGEENHTAAEFEALINNYGDLAHHVQVQETINQVFNKNKQKRNNKEKY